MPEPEHEAEHHVERKVIYETSSSTSTKSTTFTFILIVVIAIALIAWVVMQMT